MLLAFNRADLPVERARLLLVLLLPLGVGVVPKAEDVAVVDLDVELVLVDSRDVGAHLKHIGGCVSLSACSGTKLADGVPGTAPMRSADLASQTKADSPRTPSGAR